MKNKNIVNKNYKCQTSPVSYIDSLFVIFSQSFLINGIGKYMSDKKTTNKIDVLEIGCYNGRLMNFLIQNRIFVNYIGIDIRQDYLNLSTVANRKDVKLLCIDASKKLPMKEKSMDIVCMTEVLEHLKYDIMIEMLKNISKVLKNNGRLLIGCPINTKDKIFHKIENERLFGHVQFPIHEDFIKLCKKFNLNLLEYFPGYSLRSSFRFSKEIRENIIYKRLKKQLGSSVARTVFISVSNKHTGGGYYIFEKLITNKNVQIKEKK